MARQNCRNGRHTVHLIAIVECSDATSLAAECQRPLGEEVAAHKKKTRQWGHTSGSAILQAFGEEAAPQGDSGLNAL